MATSFGRHNEYYNWNIGYLNAKDVGGGYHAPHWFLDVVYRYFPNYQPYTIL